MKRGLYIIFFLFLMQISFGQNIETIGKQQPLKLNGSFSTTLNFTGTNDSTRKVTPFVYYISGTLNTSFYGISFPVSYTFSKNNSDFSNPFYRLGVSPEYKWAKAHIGYRSISFSEFTLSGHNFLGGGLELNPGLLRFGAVYGRFARKKLPSVDNPEDSIAGFSRKGFGLKLGIGRDNNFFDLLLMHIADDTTTLAGPSFENAQTPEANSVVGAHTHLTIAKKVVFDAEVALSAYTDNVFASPIDEKDLKNPSYAKRLEFLKINQSSYFANAISSQIQYMEKNFTVGLQYRRIDPGYKSMGAYYFSGDLQNITVNTSFNLLERKLSVRGSIGVQNNNLKDNKISTTGKVISKLNFSYKPTNKFGVSGNYTNYSIDQKPGSLPLNDTLKLYQVNSNFSLNPYLMLNGANGSGMINLNINLSNLNDLNQNTSDFTEVQNTMLSLNYSKNLKKPALNYALGLTYNEMETFSIIQKAYGGNASLGKSFFDNTFRVGLNASVQKTKRNNDSGLISSGGFNVNYRVLRKHNFRLRMLFTDVRYPDDAVAKSYNRYRATFSYSYSF
jgi:hypothetical protein